jgi:molybdopterin synthase catalytic subunit
MTVRVNHAILDDIIAEKKKLPGIVDIKVAIAEDRALYVGDDVMYIIIAGDIRERVLTVMTDTLNEIKARVTEKTEF